MSQKRKLVIKRHIIGRDSQDTNSCEKYNKS